MTASLQELTRLAVVSLFCLIILVAFVRLLIWGDPHESSKKIMGGLGVFTVAIIVMRRINRYYDEQLPIGYNSYRPS